MSEETAWVSTHENVAHVHEEREVPQWIYWVIVGFSLGVMGYIAYEQWNDSRKFQLAIDEWSSKVRRRMSEPVLDYQALQEWANRQKDNVVKEPDETPSAASEVV